MNARNLINSIATTGGGSYNYKTGELNPSQGYMVAIKGCEKVYKLGTEIDSAVRDYTMEQGLNLAIRDNGFLGFWTDDKGRLVGDISENIESLEDALKLGAEREQIAIWDCANGCEILIKY